MISLETLTFTNFHIIGGGILLDQKPGMTSGLNEGFATYSEALYAEAKHGKDALNI